MIACNECAKARTGKGEVVYCYLRDKWVPADNRLGCKRGKPTKGGEDARRA